MTSPMPAKDFFHAVKTALQKDSWVITHDPLTLDLRDRQFHIDLGAEKLIAAQKDELDPQEEVIVQWKD